MRRNMFVLFAGLICCILSGCSARSEAFKQHEAFMDDFLQLHEECFAITDGIKDPLTAAEAAPKINELNEKFEALYQRFTKLPPLTEEEEKRLEQKYAAEMEKIPGQFFKVGYTIELKAQASKEIIKDAIDRLLTTLKKFKKPKKSS
jgi:hypothetical protein